MTSERPFVVIVTRHWGEDGDEETFATRSLAGALAPRCRVEVVHLVQPPHPTGSVADSVFTVHRVALRGARPLRASLLRAALGAYDEERVPAPVAGVLEAYEGHAPDVPALLERLAPDSIVLAGSHQPYELGVLQRGPARRFHLVVLPLCADPREVTEPATLELLELADVVAALHPGEASALARAGVANVRPLRLGLALNRSATAERLFGVRFFGRYVLLLRRFPQSSARYERTVTHELLRDVLGGKVSVAEVDGERWRVTDTENTLTFPVNPSRVNLWRLMAHALFTVDLRPPGVLGREALESMMLGTPVLALDQSAAMAHVEAANGGLWYRDAGELLDAARLLMDDGMRTHFARQGEDYARVHHGDLNRFVEHATELVLGPLAAKLDAGNSR